MQLVQSSPNIPDGVTIQLNSSGRLEVINYNYNVPIGSIIAWAKSITGVPALPAGFVECDGAVLNNALSPLDGQTMPNLNGNSESTKKFLRGATTSGTAAATTTHTHSIGQTSKVIRGIADDTSETYDSAATTGANGNVPPYYEVVYIIRVI